MSNGKAENFAPTVRYFLYRVSVKSIFTVHFIRLSMHIAQITAHKVKYEQEKAENFAPTARYFLPSVRKVDYIVNYIESSPLNIKNP